MTKNIVVLVDGSPHSMDALKYSLETFSQPSLQFHLLFCHYSPTCALGTYANEAFVADALIDPLSVIPLQGMMSEEERQEMVEQSKQKAQEILAPYISLCQKAKVNFHSHIRETIDIKESIMDALQQLKADHVVMGSRGFGIVKRLVLGSVSDYIVHNCEIPTTVVRFPKNDRKNSSPKKNKTK
eukprot:Sdes_comp9183_c0_seq2m653